MGPQYDDLTREAGQPTLLEQLMSSNLDEFEPLESAAGSHGDLNSAEETANRVGVGR